MSETDDFDLVVHAGAVAGDANYDHAPVIHDLCAEIRCLRRQLDTAREALKAISEMADSRENVQGFIMDRARRTLAALDGEDKADG